MCAGSWVPFLRFPLWEFHVQAICFHVRVSFDKSSQLLRRFGMRLVSARGFPVLLFDNSRTRALDVVGQ